MLQRLRDVQTVSMRENGAVACSIRYACDAKQRLDDEMEESMVAKEHLDEHLEGSRSNERRSILTGP